MIKFLNVNKGLSFTLLLSVVFFIRKGGQYYIIGSPIPLLIIIGFIVLLALSLQIGQKSFVFFARTWAITLILWSITRIFLSIVHMTTKPFDGSYHMTNSFSVYALIFSVLMLAIGIYMFRSLNQKRIKDWPSKD